MRGIRAKEKKKKEREKDRSDKHYLLHHHRPVAPASARRFRASRDSWL